MRLHEINYDLKYVGIGTIKIRKKVQMHVTGVLLVWRSCQGIFYWTLFMKVEIGILLR